jgi:hypothetical protein
MLDSQRTFHRHTASAAIYEFEGTALDDVSDFRRNGFGIRDNQSRQAGSGYRAYTMLQSGSPDNRNAGDRQLSVNF